MKSIAIVLTKDLTYRARVNKIIETLSMANCFINIYDGSDIDNSQLFNKKNIHYYWYQEKWQFINNIKLLKAIKFSIITAKKILIRKSINNVLCHDITTVLCGALLKSKKTTINNIYDCSELSIEKYSGIKKIILFIMLKYSLKKIDLIIHPDEYRLQYFKKKYQIQNNKNVLIKNYPNFSRFDLKKPFKENRIKTVYFGAIIPNREHELLIKSFLKLNQKYCLDIIGFGNEKYIHQLKKNIPQNNDHIRILDPVPNPNISQVLKQYQIGFIFYKPTNLNNYYCAPNKIYEYLFNGISVIAYGLPGLIDLLNQNKIGVCINEINEFSIKDSIDKIISKKYNKNITIQKLKKFRWKTQERKLISLIK
jgi:glycosyltransferase involved in cell wall biosynthesis